MPDITTSLTAGLADRGTSLPAGHVLTTLAERPALRDEIERFGSSVWTTWIDVVADST